MTVVLVLTGLSLGVLARTLSALQSGRRSQDRAAARALAESGLAQALYAMNNLPADVPYPGTVLNEWLALDSVHTSSSCTVASCFKWRAAQDPNAYPAVFESVSSPNAYTVTSEGTVNGVTRTVTESVFRWPLGLFADQGIRLDGTPDNPDNLFSQLIGPPVTTYSDVFIGSNHAIVMSNNPGGGKQQNLFGPLAGCSGCPNPINEPGPYANPANQYATRPLVPSGPPCLPTYNFAIPIPAGPNNCGADVLLAGDLQVLGTAANPSVIYMTAGTLHLGALTMTSAVDPTLLVIHVLPGAAVDIVGATPVRFVGVLDAPKADLSCPSVAKWTFTGALKLNRFTCTSPVSDQFHLIYDPRVGQAMGYPWEASGFHEIPTPTSL